MPGQRDLLKRGADVCRVAAANSPQIKSPKPSMHEQQRKQRFSNVHQKERAMSYATFLVYFPSHFYLSMITHPNVNSIADLQGNLISISNSLRNYRF